MLDRPWIICRDGWASRKRKYWCGFKDQICAAPRPRLDWRLDPSDAIQFVRETDASQLISGLRMQKRHRVFARKIDE